MKSNVFFEFDKYEKSFREKSAKLGRKFNYFSVGSMIGYWAPNEQAVTILVMDKLKADIDNLIRIIDK